jgi:predicted porin
MKKSLIALAALATVATAAQAQSSVTVYGVMDLGLTTATNVGTNKQTVTGISNGGLSTPRIGFRGTEDLGGGLKANFNLETEILADTGAHGGELFTRASWLGLSQDGIGAIRAGRVNRIDYDLAATYDAFGGNNIGGWVALKDSNTTTGTNETALKVGERISNAIDLKTASLAGFTLTYQRGFGETAGNQSASRTDAYGVQYKLGNFDAAYASSKLNSSSSVATKQQSYYAAYNFGILSVTGGYVTYKVDSAPTVEPSGYFVGTRVPFGKTTFLAQYASLDDDAATPTKQKVTTLGVTYALSKRTTAYLIGAQNDGNGQNIVSSSKYTNFAHPASGENARAYSVGVRHTF